MDNSKKKYSGSYIEKKTKDYIIPKPDEDCLKKQTQLIACLKKKVQQLNQAILIMEEQLTVYEVNIQKMAKKFDLATDINPIALLNKISQQITTLKNHQQQVIKEVPIKVQVEKLVEVQKIVEVPLFVQKIIEKPVYIQKTVQVPIYVQKECQCKTLPTQIVST